MHQTVAIIGYGTASVNALIALRSAGYKGDVIVFSADAAGPYSPILTSYYAASQLTYDQCFPWSQDLLQALDAQILLNRPVTQLLPEQHLICTSNATFEYTKCLIASGATPSRAGFPSINGYEPLVLRSMGDAEALKATLDQPGKRILVSGTSMVALKVLEACLQQGAQTSLLGRSSHILKGNALPLVAQRFEQALQKEGVELLLGQEATCASIVHTATGEELEVEFSSGVKHRYDDIVIAHGMRPNLAFLPEGTMTQDKGLIVDEHMRTRDPDVYAAGDIVQSLDLVSGTKRIVGLWKNACDQGACAGKAIAAELSEKPPEPASCYTGCIPNTSIDVRHIALTSGGSMDTTHGQQVETRKNEDAFVAQVFEKDDTSNHRRLVGFNVFSTEDAPRGCVHDIGAMLLNKLSHDTNTKQSC